MKKTILLLFCLQSIFLFGQGVSLEWAKTFKSTSLTQSLAIAVDNNENVYTTGGFKGTVDFDPNEGVNNVTATGEDIFVSKQDAQGRLIWVKKIGSNYPVQSTGNAITVDNYGNVYVIGHFYSTVDFDPGPGVFNLTTNGSNDVFILKLDTNGNFVWAKSIGGTSSDTGTAIKLDYLGNVIVTGEFKGTVDIDPNVGVDIRTAVASTDFFICKLSNAGETIWTQAYGGTGGDTATGLAIDQQGNIFIVGNFLATVDFDPSEATQMITAVGSTGYLLKLNPSGGLIWVRRLMVSEVTGNRSYPTSLAVDANGNPVVSGHFSGTLSLNPNSSADDFSLFVSSNTDVFVAKWNGSGEFQWAKHIGGTQRMLNRGLDIDQAGNIYSVGHFHGMIDFDPSQAAFNISTAGGFDIYISKLDANGNFVSAANIGGSETDYCQGVAVSAQNNIYLTGYYFGNTDFDPGDGRYVINSTGVSISTADCFVAKYKTSSCSASGVFRQVACERFTWLDGVTYLASNNTATHTIVNGGVNGCDSTITLNLTINNPTSSSVSARSCGSYVWRENGQTYSNSGVFTHVIPNVRGCDSTITLNLTINNPTSSNVSASSCGSYVWRANGQTYSNSGVFTHVIPNVSGCDSTITLNLTINNPTSSSVSASSCGSYVWRENGQTYSNSGVFTHVIPNVSGCDSTITLNLTINNPTSSSVSARSCGSYVWRENGQTYSNSGVFTHVIPNVRGCDSTITLNLTVNNPTSSSVSARSCGSYVWRENGQTYSNSGVFTHVIPNVSGCDSTITLNLTINNPRSSSVSARSCGSYVWRENGQTYSNSGVFTHVIPNVSGCDSTITLNLTINNPTSSSVSVRSCGSYVWRENGQTYSNSGVFTHVIPNVSGCDSTITLNLTINNPTSSSVSASSCGSYVWRENGQTYSNSGVFTHVIPNVSGCDSTITLNLTVSTIDPTISLIGDSLVVAQTGAIYQWMDCSSDGSPIVGATRASFTPSQNGEYSVAISVDGCTITTDCFIFNTINVTSLDEDFQLSVFPNPSTGLFKMLTIGKKDNSFVEIFTVDGQLIEVIPQEEESTIIDLINQPNGVYLLKFGQIVRRLILAK